MQRFLILTLVAYGTTASAGEKGTEVVLDGLKSTTPATWSPKDSKITFRVHTFVVPKAEGDERDGEIVVSFFGKGSGGGLKENIERWQGMFVAPKGKTIDEATKTDKFKVGDVEVTVVDISGTFKDKFPPFAPMAKTVLRDDYRRVNVVLATENGPFFIYFVGSQKTVGANKKAFDDWLKNFK